MGLGLNFGSQSTPTDASQSATDQARQQRGSGKQLNDNATDLSKAKVNTGTQITAAKGSSVTIGTDSGPEVASLTQMFLNAVTGVSSSQAAATAAASAGAGAPPITVNLPSTAGDVDNGGPTLTDLFERSLNQPAAGTQAATTDYSSWYWIIGGVLVVVLGIFIFRKR